jgi:hypothetical protein
MKENGEIDIDLDSSFKSPISQVLNLNNPEVDEKISEHSVDYSNINIKVEASPP